MHKPFNDKDKDGNVAEWEATKPDAAATPNAVPNSGNEYQGAYGAQTTRPLVNRKDWEDIDPNRPWMDDAKTRLGIRMFSRGILGAAFFAGGGLLAKKWMGRRELGYNASESFSHAASANPLQFVAKLIDTVVGKPIAATVRAVTHSEEAALKAVTFRPTEYMRHSYNGEKVWGRTLGEETVMITFDFFCASIGDAWGRDIACWVDPNVKKTWMDDKGHINASDAVKAALKAATKYVTYNGGEDWAVSIPYAYFMKGQRSLINKASPGFKYDFDRAINGGSMKLANNKSIGNFNIEGAIDLQSRFTVYNIGTLMFREVYDYVSNLIAGKPDSLYGAPDKKEHKGLFGKAGDLVKWAARSAIKGVVIMTPSVPFFWITRAPQAKYRGIFIDPEKEAMISRFKNGQDGSRNTLFSYDLMEGGRATATEPYFYSHYDPNLTRTIGAPFVRTPVDGRLVEPIAQAGHFQPFSRTHGPVDSLFNAAGEASYKAAQAMEGPAQWADHHMPYGNAIKDTLGITRFSQFTRPFVNASISYTPYMYAKAEFANRWDNGKMDMAAERLIDGVTRFNWGEFKAGASEIWHSILNRPLNDPAREAEAQRRIKIDTTPADIFNKTQAGMAEEDKEAHAAAEHKHQHDKKEEYGDTKQHNLSWQERTVSAKTPTQPRSVNELPKALPKKYADQEAMREALVKLNPPTNSIN